MTDHDPSDDFQHLPTADGGADAARRAKKAALWKEIAERRQQAQASQPVPEVTPQDAAEPSSGLHDDWSELLSLDPDSPQVPMPPMEMPIERPIVSTPVEVETRGDMSSRKRTVIRRHAPPPPVSETITRVIHTTPTPSPAPVEVMPDEPESPPEPDFTAAPEEQPEPEAPVVHAEPEAKTAIRSSKVTPETVAISSDKTPSIKTDEPDSSKQATEKPAAPSSPAEGEVAKPSLLKQKWDVWGGKSLALSLVIHLLIIGTGGFLVVNRAMLDSQVDFLPGGTQQGQAASQALEHKIQQKKSPWLKKQPLRKIASMSSTASIVLPEDIPDRFELPESNDLLSGGKMGGALGLGGAGGGFGKGMGLGSQSGMVFQPLSMFGREIKAKKLALVLDVSTSMAPYLPRVIEEVDKVARDSIVILYFGCGLDSPPPKGLDGDDLFRTSGSEFEKFWRMGGCTLEEARKFKFKSTDVIPSESIYRILSRRPQTYFIHNVGLGYTWLALLSEQVRLADALYWFSDFQDHVDFQQILVVRENILRRKQRLYIQPFMRGSSFDLVKNQLVEPSGGDVIEAVLE